MSTAASEHILAFDVMRLGEAAFIVDKQCRITAWNDAAERLFGYTAAGLIGLHCRDVMDALHLRLLRLLRSSRCARVGHGRDPHRRCPPALPPSQSLQLGAPVVTPEKSIVLSAFAARSPAGETRIVHLIQVLPPTPTHDNTTSTGGAVPVEGAREGSEGDKQAAALSSSPQVLVRLTQREREILEMLAKGRDTREIADTLSISHITARNHIAHVTAKLGASTRLQAVIMAARVGLL